MSNYLYGMHPVLEAIRSGREIERVLLKRGLEGEQFRTLFALIAERQIPYQFVPAEKLDATVRGRHQGVIAFIPNIDYTPMEVAVERALSHGSKATVLLLDGVTDIRNLGAIARSAECMGVSCIIMPAKGGAAINADAIKASAGALLRMDVCKVSNLKMAIFYLKELGFQICAATEKSDMPLYAADFNKAPNAVILGSEGKGISNSLLALSDIKARIPMSGETESLNVSVSAAIVLYEICRQQCI